MRLASFIDDPDVLLVDAAEAGVSGAAPLIEQQVMRHRPGLSVVETHLQRVMRPLLLRVRIGEQQGVLCAAGILVVDAQQAAIAVGFDERVAARRVRSP